MIAPLQEQITTIKRSMKSTEDTVTQFKDQLSEHDLRLLTIESMEIEEKLNNISKRLVTSLITDAMTPVQLKHKTEMNSI